MEEAPGPALTSMAGPTLTSMAGPALTSMVRLALTSMAGQMKLTDNKIGEKKAVAIEEEVCMTESIQRAGVREVLEDMSLSLAEGKEAPLMIDMTAGEIKRVTETTMIEHQKDIETQAHREGIIPGMKVIERWLMKGIEPSLKVVETLRMGATEEESGVKKVLMGMQELAMREHQRATEEFTVMMDQAEIIITEKMRVALVEPAMTVELVLLSTPVIELHHHGIQTQANMEMKEVEHSTTLTTGTNHKVREMTALALLGGSTMKLVALWKMPLINVLKLTL